MALSIKTAEADALARAVAAETGESLTEAVTVALRERLERLRAPRVSYAHRVARLQARYEPSAPEFDIDYDDLGLPR